MLGDALLVAPVLEPEASRRQQLLPPGRWLELQTGKVHAGERVADLLGKPGRPPVLLREGSAIPLAVVPSTDPTDTRLYIDAEQIEWLAFPDPAGNFRG